MFSKSCEYAIRAALHIMVHGGEEHKVNIGEVSDAIGTPRHFTAKLLQCLTRKDIICSVKGPGGGFYFNGDEPDIPLMRIVEAIDGKDIFNGCALGLDKCSEDHPCPLHNHYKGIRMQILKMLNEQSLQLIAERMENETLFLSNENDRLAKIDQIKDKKSF